MKKSKGIILGLILNSLLLVSCQKNSNIIPLFLYTNDDAFINELTNEIEARFTDFNIETYYASRSQLTQNRQISEVINEGDSKILLVNTVDRLASKSIVEKAKTMQIPVIFINREPLYEDIKDLDNVYYVGTNPTNEGELQASIVDDLFNGYTNFNYSRFDKNKNGKLDVVLIKGEQGHQDTEERSNASINKLKELGYDVNLINTTFCDWSRNTAFNNFKSIYYYFLNEDGTTNIELVLSNNDDMALGIIDYLLTLDSEIIEDNTSETSEVELPFYEKYFPIVGVDYTSDSKEYIINGYLYGTVKNEADVQADAIYKLTKRLINNEPLDDFEYEFTNDKFIRTNGEIVTIENVDNF